MYDGHKCGFYVFYLSKGHKQSDLCFSGGFFHLPSLLNIFAVNLILLNLRALDIVKWLIKKTLLIIV